jgi:hypothetical protein
MNVGECCREVMLRETRGGVASDLGSPAIYRAVLHCFGCGEAPRRTGLCYCTVKATAPTVALTEPDVPVTVIV